MMIEKEQILELFYWFHRHPELSYEEFATTEKIREVLLQAGVEILPLPLETGLAAQVRGEQEGETLALRCDIDALPVSEESGLFYSSEHPGKMHACGHDAITAVNLCLAKVLAEHKEVLACNVRFLFEPGEETGQGAKHLIAHGALENPKVDAILVFHFGNQEIRHMEIQKSITTAAVGGITLHVTGKSSHWFQPQDGIDALYAASRLAVEIHRLNDTLKTQHPFVLGFGTMEAGTAGNIVADTAQLYGSLRAFTMEDFHYVWNQLEQVMRQVEQETGASICLEPGRMIPPMINDASLVKQGSRIGKELMQDHFSLGEEPFLVGDNAAFYLENVPGMRTVFLGGKKQGSNEPVHNPAFDLDEQILLDALEFFYQMVTDKSLC